MPSPTTGSGIPPHLRQYFENMGLGEADYQRMAERSRQREAGIEAVVASHPEWPYARYCASMDIEPLKFHWYYFHVLRPLHRQLKNLTDTDHVWIQTARAGLTDDVRRHLAAMTSESQDEKDGAEAALREWNARLREQVHRELTAMDVSFWKSVDALISRWFSRRYVFWPDRWEGLLADAFDTRRRDESENDAWLGLVGPHLVDAILLSWHDPYDKLRSHIRRHVRALIEKDLLAGPTSDAKGAGEHLRVDDIVDWDEVPRQMIVDAGISQVVADRADLQALLAFLPDRETATLVKYVECQGDRCCHEQAATELGYASYDAYRKSASRARGRVREHAEKLASDNS